MGGKPAHRLTVGCFSTFDQFPQIAFQTVDVYSVSVYNVHITERGDEMTTTVVMQCGHPQVIEYSGGEMALEIGIASYGGRCAACMHAEPIRPEIPNAASMTSGNEMSVPSEAYMARRMEIEREDAEQDRRDRTDRQV